MASKKLMIKNTKQYDKYKKNVENFAPLIDYIEKSNLTRESKISITTHLTLYCCSQDKYIHDLLNEAKREENSIKELSDRKINQRLDDFEQYLKDAGYAEKTVTSRVKTVRTFYRRENITVPPKDLRPLINPKLREEIKNSEVFKWFVLERNLTNESTIGGYLTSLTGYCDYYGMSIEELVEEAEQEEENNVRLKKRKIRRRLLEYRNHLYEENFSNKTVKSKMTAIIFFFHTCEIDIPKLGRKENVPYDRGISFDEVPKKEHVKKAIETTTSIKNRAVYLFCMTSCSGSAEAREFTIEEYIRGVKGLADNEEIGDINIYEFLDEVEKDLNEALKNPQNLDDSIVPVFHFVRKKKKRDYFTCITPEANMYIVNYLKTREGLTLEDKVFDYSRKSLMRAFQSVNDKNEWGWINRDRQRFFTSHQLRRLGANLIEDERLVNEISGRKFDETTEAYFKRDKRKIRKEYFKWLDELTIYQKYRVYYMTDEKYATFAQELRAEKEEKEKLQKRVEELQERINQTQEQVDDLTFVRKRSNIEKIILDYFNDNHRETILEEEDDSSIGRKKCNTICKLAYEMAIEEESNFRDDDEYLNSLVQRSIVKYTMDPNINLFDKEELTQDELELINKHVNLQLDIFKLIKSDSTLWNMVKNDQIKLKNIIVYVIKKNLDNIDDLTDDDKRNMMQEVLMEYLKVD